ncbi:hypothetical protein BJX70DRAFT_394517 [Aspergillus crustosus]
MSTYGPPYGVAARRNGTCLSSDNEVDCGNPWGRWHRCCPEDTMCGAGGVCCPTNSGCQDPILADVHCANNATWDLYQADGYFCCEHGKTGFRATNLESGGQPVVGVGCADEYPRGEYNSALVPVALGTSVSSETPSPTPTSSTTSSTTTTTSTPTSDPETPDSDSSSTNTGAIAGGVVGGVAGLALIAALIWFLLRRRKQKFTPVPTTSYFEPTAEQKPEGFATAELDDRSVRAELDGGGQNTPAYELPAHGPR